MITHNNMEDIHQLQKQFETLIGYPNPTGWTNIKDLNNFIKNTSFDSYPSKIIKEIKESAYIILGRRSDINDRYIEQYGTWDYGHENAAKIWSKIHKRFADKYWGLKNRPKIQNFAPLGFTINNNTQQLNFVDNFQQGTDLNTFIVQPSVLEFPMINNHTFINEFQMNNYLTNETQTTNNTINTPMEIKYDYGMISTCTKTCRCNVDCECPQ